MALAWRQTRRRYMVLALARSLAVVRRPRPAFSELYNIRRVCLVVVVESLGACALGWKSHAPFKHLCEHHTKQPPTNALYWRT